MKIAICLCFNDAYVKYAKALIKSFIVNNKWFNQDIVIMGDDYINITDKSLKELQAIYPNIIRKTFKKTEKLKQFINKFKEHLTNANWIYSYLKLYLFQLDEYDKLLYLDTDIIVNGDISKLFESNDDLNVCPEATQLFTRHNHYLNFYDNQYILNESYLKYDGEYFNAGVLFFGNKSFRQRLNKEFINFGLSYDFSVIDFKPTGIISKNVCDGHAFEQDMLNLYVKTYKDAINCRLLPIAYNTCTSSNPEIFEKAIIVHYWTKPEDFSIKDKNVIPSSTVKKAIKIYNSYVDEPVEYNEKHKALCIVTDVDFITFDDSTKDIIKNNCNEYDIYIYIYNYICELPFYEDNVFIYRLSDRTVNQFFNSETYDTTQCILNYAVNELSKEYDEVETLIYRYRAI